MKNLKCDKHPKYKGNKQPKYECGTCFSLYLAVKNKPRVLPKPTKVMKDKSKTIPRKKKYKDKGD